ncbi:putative LIS1 homology motif protein [Tanacetum coccineum]
MGCLWLSSPWNITKKAGAFPPLGAHDVSHTPVLIPTPLAGWMLNPPTVSHQTISGIEIGLGSPSISSALKHPRTPTNPSLDYPS